MPVSSRAVLNAAVGSLLGGFRVTRIADDGNTKRAWTADGSVYVATRGAEDEEAQHSGICSPLLNEGGAFGRKGGKK